MYNKSCYKDWIHIFDSQTNLSSWVWRQREIVFHRIRGLDWLNFNHLVNSTGREDTFWVCGQIATTLCFLFPSQSTSCWVQDPQNHGRFGRNCAWLLLLCGVATRTGKMYVNCNYDSLQLRFIFFKSKFFVISNTRGTSMHLVILTMHMLEKLNRKKCIFTELETFLIQRTVQAELPNVYLQV